MTYNEFVSAAVKVMNGESSNEELIEILACVAGCQYTNVAVVYDGMSWAERKTDVSLAWKMYNYQQYTTELISRIRRGQFSISDYGYVSDNAGYAFENWSEEERDTMMEMYGHDASEQYEIEGNEEEDIEAERSALFEEVWLISDLEVVPEDHREMHWDMIKAVYA